MPVTINTLQELQDMNNDLAEDYVLGQDIDASDTLTWNSGEGFVPIGNPTTPFTGNFDGQGFSISGLTINRPSTVSQGLFGDLDGGATVTNLALIDVSITGGNQTGGICGGRDLIAAAASFDIDDCRVTGTIVGASGGGSDCGGILGATSAFDTVVRIRRCTFDGTIGNGGNHVRVGGICGGAQGGLLIEDCYTRGTINSSRQDLPSGLVAHLISSHSQEVRRSYSAMSGAANGLTNIDWVVVDSFWDTTVGPATTNSGGTGKTTAEMQDINTYTDTATTGLDNPWDMVAGLDNTRIWGIDPEINDGYPFLQWTQEGAELQPTIDTQPTSQTVTAPASATFSGAATGEGNITYQWSVNDGGGWEAIAGATSATYNTGPTNVSMDGNLYRFEAFDDNGSAISDHAALTVETAIIPGFQIEPKQRDGTTPVSDRSDLIISVRSSTRGAELWGTDAGVISSGMLEVEDAALGAVDDWVFVTIEAPGDPRLTAHLRVQLVDLNA